MKIHVLYGCGRWSLTSAGVHSDKGNIQT